MITLLNGPAVGTHLTLRRAPLLLRVVIDEKTGEVDALDLVADQPRPNERVIVYQLASPVSRYHVKVAEPSKSGFYCRAIYKMFRPQPSEDTLRNTCLWQTWAYKTGSAIQKRGHDEEPAA